MKTMTTLQLNAEIYEALSIIAQDESLLKKAARSLKRLATMKKDETLMSEKNGERLKFNVERGDVLF